MAASVEPGPYSQACWQRFNEAGHAGPPPEGAAVGRARGRAGDSEVLIWLQASPRRGGFLAHAGPWGIAAADYAVERWCQGQVLPDAGELAKALAAPAEAMDDCLTVEDAARNAARNLESDSRNE
ncbi:hypothetical protein J2T60_001298 [Natronospira proteinivora]|uniref:Uncharacterized protein n=1 Tax=Natronospira proteinivora TaxID=1807133 RepID=A0ABT1G7P9_9GAMM|nr:hypothetical protein [Natronospira proteinivora]MCP1727333.1 hypothetical protein [Natronospira proteinivora]